MFYIWSDGFYGCRLILATAAAVYVVREELEALIVDR